MKIGILTYYKVANFGANLQAVSTYRYLEKAGHFPILLNYTSKEAYDDYIENKTNIHWRAHLEFVDKIIINQSEFCFSTEELLATIEKYQIDGIITGSDALLQHHPFLSRIHRGKRKPIHINSVTSDRMFPNPFWGVGISDKLPVALLSVSSQNSAYKMFSGRLKKKMYESLSQMVYLSVRDKWTHDMLHEIGLESKISPDPVFALNQNAPDIEVPKEELLKKFQIPRDYVLISLHYPSLSLDVLKELKQHYHNLGVECVFLPMPNGRLFEHALDYEIPFPISPAEWYSLIKNARAYIGSNMHPIVVSLHNAVPCFSIDNWGKINFWGKKENDGSSKVLHIMKVFNVENCHRFIENFKCEVTSDEIISAIETFPVEQVRDISNKKLNEYNLIMKEILNKLSQR